MAFATRNFGTPSDVADLLPATAWARLVALREEREDLHAALIAVTDAYQAAYKAKGEAKGRLDILTIKSVADRYGQTILHKDDHPSVVAAKADLAKATKDVERATEKRDARSFRWKQVASLVTAVEQYLSSAPGPLAAFTGAVKKPASIEAARKTIATLVADRQEVKAAPIPSAKVRATIRAEIDSLAEKGRPSLFGAVEYGEAIGWPKLDLPVSTLGLMVNNETNTHIIGRANAEGPNTLALFAWLHRDALLAALDKEIAEVADDGAALDDETRGKKLAQITDALLDAERGECALIDADGDTATYRSDTDPRAMLAITGPAPRDE
ncbi:hypothetical protein ACFSOZ_12725 [Mesorhizobium newzealandense]|uniref:HNH endonuclease n=1 Tax=Mesorhizobium newzealandense TaxID=1300302 RepID=A0ABW4UCW5_9HYPH